MVPGDAPGRLLVFQVVADEVRQARLERRQEAAQSKFDLSVLEFLGGTADVGIRLGFMPGRAPELLSVERMDPAMWRGSVKLTPGLLLRSVASEADGIVHSVAGMSADQTAAIIVDAKDSAAVGGAAVSFAFAHPDQDIADGSTDDLTTPAPRTFECQSVLIRSAFAKPSE